MSGQGMGLLTWGKALLERAELPVTRQNLTALVAWQQAEGGHHRNNARFNPLNTSRQSPGSTVVNSHGVRSYPSYEKGMDATVSTLRLGFYDKVRQALREGDSASAVARAVVASKWGTTGLFHQTLPGARAYVADHDSWVRSATRSGRSGAGSGGENGGGERESRPHNGSRAGGSTGSGGDGRMKAWRIPKEGTSGRIVVVPAELDALAHHLMGHLARTESVRRSTRVAARELDGDELRLGDEAAEKALRSALDAVHDESTGLPRLLRAFTRDAGYVSEARARALGMDGDDRGERTVAALMAPLAGKVHRETSRSVKSLLESLLDPPKRRRPSAPAPPAQRLATSPRGALPAKKQKGSPPVPPSFKKLGNGRIPASKTEAIGSGERLAPGAAGPFKDMRAAARRAGVRIGITDGYRSLADQRRLYSRLGPYNGSGGAAVPGTSNHGWGLSVDLGLDAEATRWMGANASRFGFFNDVPGEPWHWTYRPRGPQ